MTSDVGGAPSRVADEFAASRTPAPIVVLGSLHLDILVHAPDRPKKGETLPGSAWAYKAGGKGGNQAVAAAQFGAGVSMIGCVGNDDFGRRLLSHLRDAGVEASHVRIDPAADSGMSVAIIDAEGDYGAVIVSGANLRLGEEDLQAARNAVQNARVLVLQNEIPEPTNVAAAASAKRQRVPVILNAAPARPLDPKLAAKVDLLVVNAVEAEMLCGIAVTSLRAATEAAARLSKQVATAGVTAGGLGLALAERGEEPVVEAAHQAGRYPRRRRRLHRRTRGAVGRWLVDPGSRPFRQRRRGAFCQHAGRPEEVGDLGRSDPVPVRVPSTRFLEVNLPPETLGPPVG